MRGTIHIMMIFKYLQELFCAIRLIPLYNSTWVIWSKRAQSLLYSRHFVIAGYYKVVDF